MEHPSTASLCILLYYALHAIRICLMEIIFISWNATEVVFRFDKQPGNIFPSQLY